MTSSNRATSPPTASRKEVEAFFARPVELVAPDLLGSRIRCGGVTIELTEVEAYAGVDDPASHSFGGPTPRNAVMFGPPGRVYVYFIYGMHWAVNLVCQSDGHASACLLRAGRVVGGRRAAVARRGEVADRQLARGPGNLASALGATGALTGSTLWDGPLRWRPRPDDVAVQLLDPTGLEPRNTSDVGVASMANMPVHVSAGPRVGVSRAADVDLRFWVAGDPTVSAYRRSKRA
jgi:DNA-3-methyladenine glycosylase